MIVLIKHKQQLTTHNNMTVLIKYKHQITTHNNLMIYSIDNTQQSMDALIDTHTHTLHVRESGPSSPNRGLNEHKHLQTKLN